MPRAPPRLWARMAAQPLSFSEPPELASRLAAITACSALALPPHNHAAAMAHVSFARPQDAQNNREPWGSGQVPALGHLSALQSAQGLEASRVALPGPPHQPCACSSTYLGGLSCPMSCKGSSLVLARLPQPISSRSQSLPTVGRAQPRGRGARRSAPSAGGPSSAKELAAISQRAGASLQTEACSDCFKVTGDGTCSTGSRTCSSGSGTLSLT